MKSPAFQLYPKDFLVDTQLLTTEQTGAYWILLCNAWIGLPGLKQGFLPSNDKSLAKLSRISTRRWRGISQQVIDLFARTEDGFLYHPRLLDELDRQQSRSDYAKRSAEIKWERERANASNPHMRSTCERNAASAGADEDEEEDSGKGGRGRPEDLSGGFKEAFEVWKASLPSKDGPGREPLPTKQRRAKYEARRREGYDQATILAALTNWIHDPWEGRMQGIGTYDMAVLLRSGATVEKFAAMRPGERPAGMRPADRGFEVPISHRAQELADQLYESARATAGESALAELAESLTAALSAPAPLEALEKVKVSHGL